jgi:hypothetical protein
MGADDVAWSTLDELAAAVLAVLACDAAPAGDDALRRAALVAGARTAVALR